MGSKKTNKLETSLAHLEEAVKAYKNADGKSELPFLALSKAFEIAIEYAWRELKLRVESEGLDAPSPKAAVKQAAKIGMISSPVDWLACIDARNNSVHDYFGISEKDYADLAEKFLNLAKEISQNKKAA